MNNKNFELVKTLLKSGLVILLLLLFTLNSDVAYARGGCFSSGTMILTSNGSKSIEKLTVTDRIIGFNLTTHKQEEGEIGEIQVIKSPDYYLINGIIKVTGTHPFYVLKNSVLDIIEVKNLKLGDRLLGINNSDLVATSIRYINQPITVYNLLSITPNHNFYADGVLVHNKGGGGGGSGGGGHGSGSYKPIDPKQLPNLFLLWLGWLVFSLPIIFFREIKNIIHFQGKEFTNDRDLIEFTKIINSEFTNLYSVRYSGDNQIWKLIPVSLELDEKEYIRQINKSELIEQVNNLFVKYQNDWTNVDFDSMAKYINEPFFSMQRKVFISSFGDGFDIVYKPKIIQVVPLNVRKEEGKYIFRIQINAEMINFELSRKGFILSGEPYPRSFTEYWDVVVTNKKCCLIGIHQPA